MPHHDGIWVLESPIVCQIPTAPLPYSLTVLNTSPNAACPLLYVRPQSMLSPPNTNVIYCIVLRNIKMSDSSSIDKPHWKKAKPHFCFFYTNKLIINAWLSIKKISHNRCLTFRRKKNDVTDPLKILAEYPWVISIAYRRFMAWNSFWWIYKRNPQLIDQW